METLSERMEERSASYIPEEKEVWKRDKQERYKFSGFRRVLGTRIKVRRWAR